MKKNWIILGLIVLSVVFQSHEFWLQANKYTLKTNEKCLIDLRVGEGFEGELWDYQTTKIKKFSLFEDSQVSKDLSIQTQVGKGNNLTLSFEKPGTKLIALETNNFFIELEGKKFNSYLLEDGLFNALEYRNEEGLLEKSAKEHYTRNIKMLLNVGNKTSNSYRINTGMSLEILPSQNPYELKKAQYLDFEVLFQGKPLGKAIVKAWHQEGESVTLNTQISDASGKVRFLVEPKGEWMISIVTMVESKAEEVDWQSYWGSLTFGY
jgi:uncharacterized GH25 family protein